MAVLRSSASGAPDLVSHRLGSLYGGADFLREQRLPGRLCLLPERRTAFGLGRHVGWPVDGVGRRFADGLCRVHGSQPHLEQRPGLSPAGPGLGHAHPSLGCNTVPDPGHAQASGSGGVHFRYL